MKLSWNDFRPPATCLTPVPLSVGKKRTVRKLVMQIAGLLLLGGSIPGYTQDAQTGMVRSAPVLHRSVIRPSSAPPESIQPRQLPLMRTIQQVNLTPVNTGPGIVFTCDATVATATCNYLNTTVAGYYNATFTNANANIYIEYGNTGLGASLQAYNFATYGQYATAYGNIANKSAIQVSAQSALSTYDATPYGSDYVGLTAALATALGFTGASGVTTTPAVCSLGTTGCYNAIITITNSPTITLYYDNLGGTEPAGAYDFYAVVEHEVDEVLGTSSCVTTQTIPLSDACDNAAHGVGTPSAADLFRYSSGGHLVLDSSLSTTAGAYFSYNGGSTIGAVGDGAVAKYYNTLDNGGDYADYVPSSPNCATNQALQDESGCPGADGGLTIFNDGGSEINILTAVGYGVPASSFCKTPNPNPNPNPDSFAGPGDFNGDCKGDILWRNSTTGQLALWLMNGTTIASSAYLPAVSGWNIQAVGDFNGDGKADILWRNSTTGQLALWLMNGTTIASSGYLPAVSGWNIQGIGDFNGDGTADILWRNSTTGQLALWLMNGATIASSGYLPAVSSGWSIQEIGDLNGDGNADILWWNSTTGQVALWLMNGTTITSSGYLPAVSTSWQIFPILSQ